MRAGHGELATGSWCSSGAPHSVGRGAALQCPLASEPPLSMGDWRRTCSPGVRSAARCCKGRNQLGGTVFRWPKLKPLIQSASKWEIERNFQDPSKSPNGKYSQHCLMWRLLGVGTMEHRLPPCAAWVLGARGLSLQVACLPLNHFFTYKTSITRKNQRNVQEINEINGQCCVQGPPDTGSGQCLLEDLF